jgi:hypothetical protein
MRFLRTALTLAAVVCTVARGARAGRLDSPPPHLRSSRVPPPSIVRTSLNRRRAAPPLVPAIRVRTERGRAEILFPGRLGHRPRRIHVDRFDAPTLMRLTNGRILLSIAGSANPAARSSIPDSTPGRSAQTMAPANIECRCGRSFRPPEEWRSSAAGAPSSRKPGRCRFVPASGAWHGTTPRPPSRSTQRRTLRRVRSMGARASRSASWNRDHSRAGTFPRSADLRRRTRSLRLVGL